MDSSSLIDQNVIGLFRETTQMDIYDESITEKAELNVRYIYDFGLNSTSLKYQLKFHDSTVRYIPTNLFQKFSGLRIFSCVFCQLQEISYETFIGADHLTEFLASDNEIKILKNSTFSLAESLIEIDLNRNSIERISSLAFSGLKNLRILKMSCNRIKSLSGDLFDSLVNIQRLVISSNPIVSLEPFLFYNNTKMEMIDFRGTNISVVDFDDFSHMYNIKSVDFRDTLIFPDWSWNTSCIRKVSPEDLKENANLLLFKGKDIREFLNSTEKTEEINRLQARNHQIEQLLMQIKIVMIMIFIVSILAGLLAIYGVKYHGFLTGKQIV